MGIELKRVPLNFKWPMDKPWSGYLNPYGGKSHTCTACNGTGNTIASQRLDDLISLLLLSATDAVQGKCHPYLREAHLYNTQGKTCGKDMVELTVGLTSRAPSYLGHDSTDKYAAKKKIIAVAGLSGEWGLCLECIGDGIVWDSQEDMQKYEEWTKINPPDGEGYQIWETVSEGSPISPVFATPEELAQHMAGRPWGADSGSSYESWLRFIVGPGWAPSGVMDEHGYRSGPDAAFISSPEGTE